MIPRTHISFTDIARAATDSVGERVSWVVAGAAGLFSLSAQQLGAVSGLLAIALAVLNIILAIIKIRKEMKG